MNAIGANTWIWVSPLTDARLAELAPRIRDWGFDVIELPIEQPGDWDPGRAADLLQGLGLTATTCAVMPDSRDLVRDDTAVVALTQDYLRTCVDTAARVGASVVAGPIYSSVGRTWLMDGAERSRTVERLVEALRPVVDHAARRRVRLAIEPLNRFETYLVNTAEQCERLVNEIGERNVGFHLDSFHMNIEEKNSYEAIKRAGSRLYHFHACENDRGAPGSGRNIDWENIAAALKGINYGRQAVIESFTPKTKSIAAAAAIWRPLAPTQDALAKDGLAFLRKVLE